jgi:hypothetical protein
LHRLADALDVTTDYLLGRVNERDGLAGADKRHRLKSDGRDAAASVIEMLAKKPGAARARVCLGGGRCGRNGPRFAGA